MEPVVLSQDFKIELPADVLEGLKLQPGAKLQVFQIGERIEIVPERDVRSLRGKYPGVGTPRDGDEEPA